MTELTIEHSPFRGDRLFNARINCGFTQEELAESARCSRFALHKWETGKARPQARYVRALADVLKVTIPWLRGTDAVGGGSVLSPAVAEGDV